MEDKRFMEEALAEAKLALKAGEVPVGAIIVKDGVLIGRGHNTREENKEIHGHAEINAILDAEKNLGTWQLDGCRLYVTLEPCLMCAGAIAQARIASVFFGAKDEQEGAYFSAYHVGDPKNANPLIYPGLLKEECEELLNCFFDKLRKNK